MPTTVETLSLPKSRARRHWLLVSAMKSTPAASATDTPCGALKRASLAAPSA
jgi:hypothetical protein